MNDNIVTKDDAVFMVGVGYILIIAFVVAAVIVLLPFILGLFALWLICQIIALPFRLIGEFFGPLH